MQTHPSAGLAGDDDAGTFYLAYDSLREIYSYEQKTCTFKLIADLRTLQVFQTTGAEFAFGGLAYDPVEDSLWLGNGHASTIHEFKLSDLKKGNILPHTIGLQDARLLNPITQTYAFGLDYVPVPEPSIAGIAITFVVIASVYGVRRNN